jgi:hypothetical protein
VPKRCKNGRNTNPKVEAQRSQSDWHYDIAPDVQLQDYSYVERSRTEKCHIKLRGKEIVRGEASPFLATAS